jgi:hypothetical protein
VGLAVLAGGTTLCLGASRLVVAGGFILLGRAIVGFFGESRSLSTEIVDEGLFNGAGFADPGRILEGRGPVFPPETAAGRVFAGAAFGSGRARALISAFSKNSLIFALRMSSTPSRN